MNRKTLKKNNSTEKYLRHTKREKNLLTKLKNERE